MYISMAVCKLSLPTGLLAFKSIRYLCLVTEMQRKIWNLVLVLHQHKICGLLTPFVKII